MSLLENLCLLFLAAKKTTIVAVLSCKILKNSVMSLINLLKKKYYHALLEILKVTTVVEIDTITLTYYLFTM